MSYKKNAIFLILYYLYLPLALPAGEKLALFLERQRPFGRQWRETRLASSRGVEMGLNQRLLLLGPPVGWKKGLGKE